MSDIDTYLATVPAPQRAALENIRNSIHEFLPEAEETISYGMPTFKYRGKYLIGFASFKNHMSIFPGGEITSQLEHKLTDYKTAKGTIQFTLDHPLETSLLKEIITLRAQSIANN